MGTDTKQVKRYQSLLKSANEIKEKMATIKGRRSQVFKDLKAVTKKETKEEAEDLLEAIDNEINSLEAEIQALNETIRKKFPQLGE